MHLRPSPCLLAHSAAHLLAFSPQRKGDTDGKSFLRTTKLVIRPFVLGGETTVLQGTRVKSQGFDLDCSKEPSSVTAAAA